LQYTLTGFNFYRLVGAISVLHIDRTLLVGAAGNSGAPARETGDTVDIAALDRCYPYKKTRASADDGNMDRPKDVGSSNLQRDLMGALDCDESYAFHAALALQVRNLPAGACKLEATLLKYSLLSDHRGTSWFEAPKSRERIQAIFLDHHRRRCAAICVFKLGAIGQNHGCCWIAGFA
jgi:hypothetical protein